MLNLLKEKSKVGYKPRERKKFKPYLPGDRSSSLVNLKPQQPGADQQPPGKKKIKATMIDNYDKDKDQDMGK